MNYKRIISLVPSLTELLIYLGLQDKLVGRTRFCIHPEKIIKQVPIIGGTKNPNIERIQAARPDYILANKEENRREDIELLQQDFHVHLTEIDTIEDALLAINEIGATLNVGDKAKNLISNIQNLIPDKSNFTPIKTAYFIWKEPWMVAGGDTYVNEVLKKWGLINVFEDRTRYPIIELEELNEIKPDLIILSSEPYPFKEKHIPEVLKYAPNSRFELMDGEWFSWYGSRMVPAFKALNEWRSTY